MEDLLLGGIRIPYIRYPKNSTVSDTSSNYTMITVVSEVNSTYECSDKSLKVQIVW